MAECLESVFGAAPTSQPCQLCKNPCAFHLLLSLAYASGHVTVITGLFFPLFQVWFYPFSLSSAGDNTQNLVCLLPSPTLYIIGSGAMVRVPGTGWALGGRCRHRPWELWAGASFISMQAHPLCYTQPIPARILLRLQQTNRRAQES